MLMSQTVKLEHPLQPQALIHNTIVYEAMKDHWTKEWSPTWPPGTFEGNSITSRVNSNGRRNAREGVRNAPLQNWVLCQHAAWENKPRGMLMAQVWHSQIPMTWMLSNNLSADLIFVTTPQESGQQALEYLLSVLAERKYSQLIKDRRKDGSDTHLSSTLYGQPPLKPSLDHCSNLWLYFRPIFLLLQTES